MTTFYALLTGGGLLAAGGLLSGLLTDWLGAKRDKRGHDHEQKMALEARRQDRLDRAYTELGAYLSRYGDWAMSVQPVWGPIPPPDPLPPQERWRIEALVTAYGSTEVRRLLEIWFGHAKKIDNADGVIRRVNQSSNPSPQLDAEARREQLALPGYKNAMHDADDAIRDRMRRELAGDV